jgi:sterol desaturase/sphingolipid hydroxylase (fatty acid hydroxylase superfamily)
MMRGLLRSLLLPLATSGFALLFVMERRRPLRRRVSSTPERLRKNLELGAITGAAIQMVALPAIAATARLAERRRLGLLQRIHLPEGMRIALAVILLDYTYYWWHWMLHHLPFLWRFHLVHHTDLDLDLTTALRFHLGEWILSLPFRMLQTIAIGAPERSVRAFESAMFMAIMFHHSNLRLPLQADRWLRHLLVTPRMHGIHHSIVERQTNSNFGTLFTAWDHMHGTITLGVPQEEITIGVPAYRSERELSFVALMALPFEPQRQM